MRVGVKVSFCGALCGYPGQELDIPESSPALADLLRAGYVVPLEGDDSRETPPPKAGKRTGGRKEA